MGIGEKENSGGISGKKGKVRLEIRLRRGRYKLGFCPNGPNCRYTHAKLPGPPPPVEEEQLENLWGLNLLMCSNSSKFNNHNNRAARPAIPLPQGIYRGI
ncbi:hypothetical protein F3Y22_tig00111993pilonHSYRG00080 [Hibiscus syriacus]|uniref:C3H1-type domain-containing protein n=1 Tax=Hibiscus syriacus TaxID=106335 RepID=A0A6A2X813_HIBSY|nr:hypothetical protein F3Y22_tig00111993pilonHSYRG00080 [Hibiscus syriacus]